MDISPSLLNPTLYRPLIVSLVSTIAGTFVGLTLSTLGAYVLIQKDMPGRSFLSGDAFIYYDI